MSDKILDPDGMNTDAENPRPDTPVDGEPIPLNQDKDSTDAIPSPDNTPSPQPTDEPPPDEAPAQDKPKPAPDVPQPLDDPNMPLPPLV